MDSSCITLDPSLMQKFKLSKVFRDSTKHINSIDFDHSGEVCVTSSEDENINLYDAITGKHKRTVPSKKYGVTLAKFAHRQNNIIYASTKGEDTIRYLSLHDYRFIRYFQGHKNKIVSLEMSPLDDKFLSGSIDDTVRLWDLRSANCQGPFSTFDVHERNRHAGDWTSLAFSNDGNNILVSTRQDGHYLVDSFDGSIATIFKGHTNNAQLDLKACFTPDSKFVVSGSQTGQIHIWERSGKRVSVLEGHNSSVSCVMFNPKYCSLASACPNLAFWIPDI